MSLLSYVPGTVAWRRRRDGKLCRDALEHIQEVVDQELPPRQLAHLSHHLDACRRCGIEAETIRGLKEAIVRVSGQADAGSVAKLEEIARKLCEERPAE